MGMSWAAGHVPCRASPIWPGCYRAWSEQRVGELEECCHGAGWAKREHVFVKVLRLADGPPTSGGGETDPMGISCYGGQSVHAKLQQILHWIGSECVG
jgi:hypothetical protein